MTVTSSTAINNVPATGSTTVAVTLSAANGGAVPNNATIVLGVHNRSNETAVITGISDTVNGAWSLNYVAGPVDSTTATMRGWMPYRNGCAAGDTTITVTFDGAINSQIAGAWFLSDQGAMTYDAAATTLNQAAGTNVDSNTVAATGAGVAVGALTTNNAQAGSEPIVDGAGETRLTNHGAGSRVFLFKETYASAGNYGFETTVDSAATLFMVGAFLEPAGTNRHPFVGKLGFPLIGRI
jgi:hypothetical protein